MNVPNEFTEFFQGIDLTKREIAFLIWLTEWDQNTIRNMRTVLEKVRAAGVAVGSISQPSNEPLALMDLASYNAPVWIKNNTTKSLLGDGWAEVECPECLSEGIVKVWWPGNEVEDTPRCEDYGRTWLAYRRPPEGEEEKT